MRTFVLAVFAFCLSAGSASALSPRERVWVLGPRNTELSSERTLSVFDATGKITTTLPGPSSGDYPSVFSVSAPGDEFWVSLIRYSIGSVIENGRFHPRLPAKPDWAFYVGNNGKVYWNYSGGITKVTLLANDTYKEEFLLQSGTFGTQTENPLIAVDGMGRVYAALHQTLWRYNPATQEVLNHPEVFPTSLATATNVAYFIKQQDGLIYKVEDDWTYHLFTSSVPKVRFIAVDTAGNIIALAGTVPQLSLWQITPDGAASPFSPITFKEAYGLGITHGGHD